MKYTNDDYFKYFDETLNPNDLQLVARNLSPPDNHGFDSDQKEMLAVAKNLGEINASNIIEALKTLGINS